MDYTKFKDKVASIKKINNIQQDRLQATHEIVASDDFIDYYTEYMHEYFNVNPTGKDNQSDKNRVARFIEIMADSILYTSDVREENKEAVYNHYSNYKMTNRLNKDINFNDVNIKDDNGNELDPQDKTDYIVYKAGNKTDFSKKNNNYYLPNKVKIVPDDYKDSDFKSTIRLIKCNGETYEYDVNLLQCYEDFKCAVIKNMKFRLLAEINNDQILLKTKIKCPIYFKKKKG